MKQKLFVVLLAAAILPCSVFADQATTRKPPQRRQQQQQPQSNEPNDQIPDGDSCGLGWQVTQKKTLSATTTRGTTNAFVPPTFGMTTGTIGCAQHPLSKRDEDGAKYAYNNFDALSVEMAEGQGEFLKGFAQTMGCADVDSFSHMTQSHYRSIMNNGNASSLEMFDNVKAEIKGDTVLAISCGAV